MPTTKESVNRLLAHIAEMGGEALSQGMTRDKWRFRCARGHEFVRQASSMMSKRSWCHQCVTDDRAASLETFIKDHGCEITRKSIHVTDKWGFRCAHGHEWERCPLTEMRIWLGCRQCKVDTEASAAIIENGDSGPLCVDCWERPTSGRDICRLCRSRHRRKKKIPRRDCADCGKPAKRGWTRCGQCVRDRKDMSGITFAGAEKHHVYIRDSIRKSAAAARVYGACPCGRSINDKAKLVDPALGYAARGVLKRAEAEGWPDKYEAGCPKCWPWCPQCKGRFRKTGEKVCPSCIEAEAYKEAARRAAKEAKRERRRKESEDRVRKRAKRKVAGTCIHCGRTTRHLHRTSCNVCRKSNPKLIALKVRTMEAYGGKCSSCGCSILALLRIDHIDRARPKGAPRTGAPLWAWLEEKGWPTDHFRCLCGKCNQAVEFYGYLPTEGRPPDDWNHDMLLSRLDGASGRLRSLCQRVEAIRKTTPHSFPAKSKTKMKIGMGRKPFAKLWGMSEPTVKSLSLMACSEPGAKLGMPTGPTLRKIAAILCLPGKICRACGHCLPPSDFKPYDGRCDRLRTTGVGVRDRGNRCKLCRRALAVRNRLSMLEKYGGCCECCGETRYEFLALDHIGGEMPVGWPRGGTALCGRLNRESRQSSFRLLCHGCNWAYYAYGQRCPHQWVPPGMSLLSQSTIWPQVTVGNDVLAGYRRIIHDETQAQMQQVQQTAGHDGLQIMQALS